MPISYLIINTVMTGLFSWLLIILGLRLFKIPSYKAHIAAYRKDPKKFDWFDHYFLGFRLFNAKLMEITVNIFGDKLLSLWFRFSGILFILFAVFFIIGLIALWILNLGN